MSLLDAFSTYLYALKPVVIVTAVLMAVSGIDDLFIDIVYWARRAWRKFAVYQHHERLDCRALNGPVEKSFAIMVPAWHETGVVGRMVELAATTLDYENYHIFVGTYPNDPDTQLDVDEICARFPNVHKIVCARPGPTSKADCLNNVLDAILQYEKRATLSFAGFVLHDAEDVVSPMELRLFNYLVERKDLIQIPVYPLERPWRNFTGLHYLDEFAEVHGKDVPVREALAGQVPSAGVGTCFSRRAVVALLAGGDGIAFDVQSLTEDYDIGIRLREHGLREIFVRFPVIVDKAWSQARRPLGQRRQSSSVICVREHFPETAQKAIRQKSRWIIGIVYQGYKTHKWTKSWMLNYFLWRDRKGALNNFVSFAAMLILLQLVAIAVVTRAWPQAPRFLSIFEGGGLFTGLLWLNCALMGNRICQRVVFVTGYYGAAQGLMSIPRLFWGNYINFMANVRAIRKIVESGDARRVAWDKTSHAFPSVGDIRPFRPLGGILVERGVITRAQFDDALLNKSSGLRPDTWLVHNGMATTAQIAVAVAEQAGVEHEHVEASILSPSIVSQVPSNLALRYAVLPLRTEGGTLVLASESGIDPVSLSALSRKLDRRIRYVIAHKGQVTVGLRRWYARKPIHDPRRTIDHLIDAGLLPASRASTIWETFVSRQVMLAEVLTSLGYIDIAAFHAALQGYERSSDMLGDFLVDAGLISRQMLIHALVLQAALQPSMSMLLRDAGIGMHQLPPRPSVLA